MKYLLLSIFLSTTTFAHDLSYTTYLKLQESLAKDDFAQAKESWQTICEKEIGHYVKDYKYTDCGKKIDDIKKLRESFKALSEIYIKNGEDLKDGTIVIAKCPMANARWLQKKGTIENPYYGASMLQCGDFEK